MREIKFRTIDKETHQIYDGDRIEADDSIIVTLSYGQLVAFYVGINGDYEELILNQWTGLTDKNGNEIYEGDILKDKSGLGEVKWIQEHSAFLVFSKEPAQYHFLESDGQLKESEVFGNIYNNPDWDF